MKNFTKKICAVITLVAMLASLGVCGFAKDATGATVKIIGYEWSDVTDGVITATVYYTVEGTIGDLGATMLTYAKGTADDDLEINDEGEGKGVFDEDDTAYADTMEIVGIDQDEPNLVDAETGTYAVEFPVALYDGESKDPEYKPAEDVRLDYGEDAVILIGGDGVTTPGAVLLSTPWVVETLTFNAGGSISISDAGSPTVVYSNEEDELKEAIAKEVLEEFTAEESTRTVTATGEAKSATLSFADTTEVLAVTDKVTDVVVNSLDAEKGEYTATVTITVKKGSIDDYSDEADPKNGRIYADKEFAVNVSGTRIVDEPGYVLDGKVGLDIGGDIDEEIDITFDDEAYADFDAEDVATALATELEGAKVVADLTWSDSNAENKPEDVTVEIALSSGWVRTPVVDTENQYLYTVDIKVPAETVLTKDTVEFKLEGETTITLTINIKEEDNILYGDVDGNGTVNARDCSELFKYIATKKWADRVENEEKAYDRANVDLNGAVNARDASHIFKYIANKEKNPLPVVD